LDKIKAPKCHGDGRCYSAVPLGGNNVFTTTVDEDDFGAS